MKRLCGKCGQPILNDEKYTSYDKFSASAGGDTVHLHVECPPKPRLLARG
ncbi:hypothetical protein [Streptomyces sp. GQFP]|nr:hypothetical protein [Streptomyces sp. GQFP]UIX33336.1 hypothetical protein LUX31_26845 [Streptomyces sp. GQFP]